MAIHFDYLPTQNVPYTHGLNSLEGIERMLCLVKHLKQFYYSYSMICQSTVREFLRDIVKLVNRFEDKLNYVKSLDSRLSMGLKDILKKSSESDDLKKAVKDLQNEMAEREKTISSLTEKYQSKRSKLPLNQQPRVKGKRYSIHVNKSLRS